MTKTTATAAQIAAAFDALENNDEWLGFGYIGDRRNARAEGYDTTIADRVAFETAAARGVDLFTWANSKNGRWYGDCAINATEAEATKWAARYVI